MSSIFSNEVLADVPGPVPVTGDFLTDAQLRAAPVDVTGDTNPNGLTDAQLRAAPVEVDGSGFTQPISAAALPLPTGASTEAKQDAGNASLVSIDTKTLAPGQATMAASSPVVIASNQTAIPVTFSTAAGVPSVSRITVDNTAAVTLASADSTRKRVLIHNESGNLHVKLGTAASTTDYTYRLTPNTFLEVDFSITTVITGRKAAGSGEVQVTLIA